MMIADPNKKPHTKLTSEEQYSHNRRKYCHISKKRFKDEKDLHKVRDHFYYTDKYRGAAHRKCSKDNSEERKIPVVFHNGSTCDYHFIMKEITKKVDGIECLGENSEKYISCKALLNKEDSDNKAIRYKLKFIDSIRFLNASLQNPTDNLSELNKCTKCNGKCSKYRRHNNTFIYSCKKCGKSYKSIVPLKEKFSNVYAICNNDLDKLLLSLKKGIYPYGHMDKWSRFNQTTLPDITNFYSEQGIANDDYDHAENV